MYYLVYVDENTTRIYHENYKSIDEAENASKKLVLKLGSIEIVRVVASVNSETIVNIKRIPFEEKL